MCRTNFFFAACLLAFFTSPLCADTNSQLPIERLSGTWVQSTATEANPTEAATKILELQPKLTFHNHKSNDFIKSAFIEDSFKDAPLHIGSVTADNGDARLLVRGRIGYLEFGLNSGGGTPTNWEPAYLIKSRQRSKDTLIIGTTHYRRE